MRRGAPSARDSWSSVSVRSSGVSGRSSARLWGDVLRDTGATRVSDSGPEAVSLSPSGRPPRPRPGLAPDRCRPSYLPRGDSSPPEAPRGRETRGTTAGSDYLPPLWHRTSAARPLVPALGRSERHLDSDLSVTTWPCHPTTRPVGPLGLGRQWRHRLGRSYLPNPFSSKGSTDLSVGPTSRGLS